MEELSNRSNPTTGTHQPPSKSELVESAKLIAKAAKSAKTNDNAEIDKAKVAGAAADILAAAKLYGHHEDSKLGKYLSKAEDYLQHYHSSHSAAAAAAADAPKHHAGDGGGGGGGGGGAGDYIKMGQGLLKKKENGGEGAHSGVGAGDYIKMAQSLFK